MSNSSLHESNGSSVGQSAGTSRHTLFVANKWDLVSDKPRVLEGMHKKLDSHWLISDDGSQLLPLAATIDHDHLRAGYLGNRLENVIES